MTGRDSGNWGSRPSAGVAVVGTPRAPIPRARDSTAVRAIARDDDPRRAADVGPRVGRAFVAADADANASRALRALDLTLTVDVVDGESVAVRVGRDGGEVVDASAGPGGVVLRGDAAVLHRVFRGAQPVGAAIGDEVLVAEGAVNRILLVCARLEHVCPAYRRLLRRELESSADDEPVAVGA